MQVSPLGLCGMEESMDAIEQMINGDNAAPSGATAFQSCSGGRGYSVIAMIQNLM